MVTHSTGLWFLKTVFFAAGSVSMEYRASMGVPSGHFGFCPFGTLWLLAVGCWLAGDKLIYWEHSFGTFGAWSLWDTLAFVPSGHSGYWLLAVGLLETS
jgi:hypothetical protein